MKKKIIITVLAVVIIIGLLAVFKFVQINGEIKKFKSAMKPKAKPVTTMTLKPILWPKTISSIATIKPVQQINVAPQTTGIITKIHFASGQVVSKGQPLLELSSDVTSASIKADEAALKLSQVNLKRDKSLKQKGAISISALDTSQSTMEQAMAKLEGDKALLAQKNIKAPFSGQLGIRQVSLGQFLNIGTPIVSLQTLNPMFVNFYVPDQDLSQIKIGQKIALTTDAYPKKTFKGHITTIDPQISSKTLGVEVQGTIDNPIPYLLKGGMYADVIVTTGQPKQVIAIPRSTINFALEGNSVFIVHQDNHDHPTVQRVYIKMLDEHQSMVRVSGLKANELLVTAGQSLLENDMPVRLVKTKGH